MAKEPDQTRWRGIRPTDPSEDIPITLDGEVAHVIVDSGGGGLQPGAPLLGTWRRLNCIPNTFYTAVTILGAGHIQRIHPGIGTTFYYCQTKVTIDALAPVTYICDVNTQWLWQSLASATDMYKEIPISLIKYNTGFKIELQHTAIGNKSLLCLWSYLPD